MAKRSLEDFLARLGNRHAGDVREQLAKALHKNSHYDGTKNWDGPKPGGKLEFFMTEAAKEDWRWMADRFTKEIAPKFGIKVVRTKNDLKNPSNS